MSWTKRLMAAGTLLGVSVIGVVKSNEGYSESAYYDSAGIATICYGETNGVKIGDVKTKAECDEQLVRSLESYSRALDGIPFNTTDVVALGALDMTYNIGVYGFNSSSVKKAIIKGDYVSASKHVLDWKYITYKGSKYDCSHLVKGKPNRVCYGLWKRRLWQSDAIGNKFKTPQEAMEALYATNR